MSLQDRELLRLHIEAVWGIQLPARLESESVVLSESEQPQWQLYAAALTDGTCLHIWRPDVAESARGFLRRRGTEALALSQDAEDEPGTSREIALQQNSLPIMDLSTAQSLACQLTLDDQALIEDFNPQASVYELNSTIRPLVGVVRAGRLLSVAHSSRRTPEACELGIDTRPEVRRQGYALAATIVWADMVAHEGLVPIYSAFATNHASLRLAAAAGYRAFARGATIK